MTAKHRSIPLALATAAAVVAALAVVAFTAGHATSAGAATAHHGQHGLNSPRAVQLREDMRKLWEDHVTWTRLAIISLTTNSPDTQATVARLLQNQVDIGNAIKPYYGDAAGEQLTALLREHILIAADLIAAAKQGDASAVAAQQARWTANADQIAEFLAKANPRFWNADEMKAMMHDHLRLTTNEVVARLQGNWTADVQAYDAIVQQALGMADMLSSGIIGQFPHLFHGNGHSHH
jgi:hypothetical protein